MPRASSARPDRHSLDFDLVRLVQVRRYASHMILFGVFAAVIVGIVLWGRIANSLLVVWLCGSAAVALGLGWDLRRTDPGTHIAQQAWERRLAFGLLVQGLLWFMIFYSASDATLSQRSPVQLVVYATTFSATVALCISLPAFLALVVPVSIGQMIWMTAHPATTTEAAFISILYLVVLVTGLLSFRRVLLRGVSTSLARRQLLAEHEAVFNDSLVGLAHSRDRRFVRVNQEFARIYGLPSQQLEGASTRVIFSSDESWLESVTRTENALASSAGASAASTYERDYTHPDGRTVRLRVEVSAIDRQNPAAGLIFAVIDITEARNTARQLEAREQAYRTLAETYRVVTSAAPALIWATDTHGVFTFLGERGSLDILGLPAAEAIGKRNSDVITIATAKCSRVAFRELLAGATLLDQIDEIVQRNGRRLFISTSGGPIHDAGGNITGVCGISIDVTQRELGAQELTRTRTQLTSAIDNMSDGFALFGPDQRLALCNRRYAAMIDPQLRPQEMAGLSVEELLRLRLAHGERVPAQFLGDTEAWIRDRLLHHTNADETPQLHELDDGRWLQTTKRRTPDGSVVGVYTDITGIKRAEEAVRQLSQHDALTGLPNRRLLQDRLALSLARAKRQSARVGLLLIDLDGFKPVNDNFGHRAGDEVLRVVAQRLRECVREADTVARHGGDEFVIVLDSLDNNADAGAVAAKVLAALKRPIEPVWASSRNTPDFRIGGSIGISLYPQDGANPELLMRHADAAMYRAKKAGRGRFAYHSDPGSDPD